MNYADFLSDEFFLRGIMQVADIQMSNDDSGKTYLYKFSYESETSLTRKVFNIELPGTVVNKFKALMNLIQESLMLKCMYEYTQIVIKMVPPSNSISI